MPTLKDVIEDSDWLTEKISSRIWTVSTAVLATSLAFLVEASSPGEAFLSVESLLLPILLSLSAIVCDFLQYFFASLQTNRLIAIMEKEELDKRGFDVDDWRRWLRLRFFELKVIFSIFAVITICWPMFKKIVSLE